MTSTLHSSGYQVGGYRKGQLSIARVFAQGIPNVGDERIARQNFQGTLAVRAL
jgi:hypothetical protein